MKSKVKVCDAICGAGKTQSCIKMMNENRDKRFVFITPYLTEVERIKNSCTSRFYSPETKAQHKYSKLEDLHELLREGVNIASTHALFSYYNEETIELIKAGGYTLVLDEVMNLFQPVKMSTSDINLLLKADALKSKNGDILNWNDDAYEDGVFSNIRLRARSNNLIKYNNEMYFWGIPPILFECFKEIYLLTYMFEYQLQKYFFDIYGIEYELIGTRKIADGIYEFCPLEQMDRKRDLRNKIHILSHKKLNSIGDEPNALSATWFKKHAKNNEEKIIQIKSNLINLFTNLFVSRLSDRMWTTFKENKMDLQGKRYIKGFVPYNMRAVNDYSNKKYLAYCANVYMPTWAKNYLMKEGAMNVSEEMYAISTLIQWLFRSAIRKGEEVWLYLPSLRMRTIFTKWLDNLAEGKDLELITIYETNKLAKHKKNEKNLTTAMKNHAK